MDRGQQLGSDLCFLDSGSIIIIIIIIIIMRRGAGGEE